MAMEKAMEIAGKAVDKQLEIMEEQRKKGEEFVNQKVKSIVHRVNVIEYLSYEGSK